MLICSINIDNKEFLKRSTPRYEIWRISGCFSEKGINFHKTFIHNALE